MRSHEAPVHRINEPNSAMRDREFGVTSHLRKSRRRKASGDDERQIDITRASQISDFDRTGQLEEPHAVIMVFVKWSRSLKGWSKALYGIVPEDLRGEAARFVGSALAEESPRSLSLLDLR